MFTVEPDSNIPYIPTVDLSHNMEELAIDEEMIKKNLIILMCANE